MCLNSQQFYECGFQQNAQNLSHDFFLSTQVKKINNRLLNNFQHTLIRLIANYRV